MRDVLNTDSQKIDKITWALLRDLKSGLIRIARQAELDKSEQSAKDAERLLRLIDDFLLVAQSEYDQTKLHCTSFAVGEVLYDLKQEVEDQAKQNSTSLNLQLTDANVWASKPAFKTALQALIEMSIYSNQSSKVEIKSTKTKSGLRLNLYSDLDDFKPNHMIMAEDLKGNTARPAGSISTDSGLRFAIASSLVKSFGSDISYCSSRGLKGLSFTVPYSKQLSLV